ncbi:hypothetical protein [Colwellia sp. TT2012]|uniref:hypothetical protein n=1 Tax=Colwellia sp. TT2012 TaxID=1720342 RepID=UPI00070BA129|nr:hypothetical protein [Colwellia sp. TT2012]
MKSFLTKFWLSILLLGAIVGNANANASSWPQELTGDKATIIIYQPQPEKLVGNILTGRAAMQLELKNKKEPVFGVFWFSSTIETDRDTNSVIISNIEVIKVGWPDSKDSDEAEFTEFVEQELQNSSFTGSLSKLTATLASSKEVQKSLDNIKNDPPVIIFKDQLAVLLSYDGKPIFKDIENSPYQRALNTQFAVIKVNNKSQYYLTSGSIWYQASNELGPWQVTNNPPADLVKMIAKDAPDAHKQKPKKIPQVVTATKATELVVSDGSAAWTSLTGGKLLYVKNTETPWLREIASGEMYLLLSGRWFKSKNEQGPWVFVRGDKLPKSFKDIPPDSAIGGLRVSVAGTDEANQAVLNAQIPQTAAIKRSEAKLTVQYDGEPKFVHIKDTKVDYAVNTSAQVLKVAGKFFAVDNGVWFVANNAKGPWLVADTIPAAAIAQIPPSSPVYNTTYVKIYDSTPEVVYVGYTPGYMWSYPYYGVPIYGTGWYYPPYYGRWYYPRPPTWGLHVGYNPWTGWNVGVSWGGPFFSVGIVWGGGYHNHYRGGCCYGGGYHGGYRGGHNTININGDINIGNSTSIGNRHTVNNNIGNRSGGNKLGNNNSHRNNLYNNTSNKHRNAKKALSSSSRSNKTIQKARSSSKRANNVFADSKGSVVRHENGQWQKRSNKNWQTIPKQGTFNSSTRPIQQLNRQGVNKGSFDHQRMNRELHGRQMGNMSRGGHQPRANVHRGR